MDRYVTLVGAEDVARAGSRMAEAGSSMQSAASTMENALERHASRSEEVLRAGLPADQLEILGLVALLNFETAIINAEVARYGETRCDPHASGTAERLDRLVARLHGGVEG